MEVSALRYSGGIGLHGRSPLLRLQSDDRLISMVRRGNGAAFEMLVSRYQSRLLAFCRHLLGSREDAEDVLQEVLTAAFNAMIADERPINVRPWLYRIARNRCLNHLRRIQPVGVDSMDIHLSDFGASTADKVHMAEEFRLLVGDIQSLPETQRTALVLREMDALSYDQIAEAMETTVPSVKSLLVRARLSLAEASEARLLSCEQVRLELAEVAEGLLPKCSPPVRRHMRTCTRCGAFQKELRRTSKALAALLPLGPLALLKQLAFAHIGHSAGAGSGASASAGTGAAVGSGAAAGGAMMGGAGGLLPFGLGAVATKTAAGLAAAALVTAGAVEVQTQSSPRHRARAVASAPVTPQMSVPPAITPLVFHSAPPPPRAPRPPEHHQPPAPTPPAPVKAVPVTETTRPAKPTVDVTKKTKITKVEAAKPAAVTTPAKPAGTTQTQSITTVLPSTDGSTPPAGANDQLAPSTPPPATSPGPTTTVAPGGAPDTSGSVTNTSAGNSGTGSTSGTGTTDGTGSGSTSTGTGSGGPGTSTTPGAATSSSGAQTSTAP